MNIQLLNSILEDEYEVYFATNGRKGLEIAELNLPDIVLLDVVMPDMDGFEVIGEFKKNSELKDIPIIFITSLGADEDEQKGFESGAVDYISKPFRPEIAKVRIRNHLLLKRQRDLLFSMAIHDQLTNLFNRRYLYEFLEKEWFRSVRSQKALSVILADIDFFKKYNDTYGHQMGDQCLVRVASVLRQSIKRPMDIAARYGGEEFILVLPETGMPGAEHTGQSIIKKLHEIKIPHEASDILPYVTMSMGITTMVPRRDVSFEEIVKKADNNLYRAKEKGRNCLVKDDLPF
ncbi:MAG: diguanylate cyclase [Spirochaetales bacterium]|nr:diguanylate cyclase [Spirochaetales bacterium]